MAHRPASDYDDTERRIRAAMTLAGIQDFKELAGRIGSRNLGESTLRRLNADKSTRLHLQAIAGACDLPYEFFTADFQTLAATPADELAAELRRLHGELRTVSLRLDALELANLGRSDEGPQQGRASQ